jgi:hypothetical protein
LRWRWKQVRLDKLAADPEAAWAEARWLIGTKVPARYDEAVALLVNLREVTRGSGAAGAFDGRLAALREEHRRKPGLMARLDRAGLTA